MHAPEPITMAAASADDGLAHILRFEEHPSRSLTVLLFRDVTNCRQAQLHVMLHCLRLRVTMFKAAQPCNQT